MHCLPNTFSFMVKAIGDLCLKKQATDGLLLREGYRVELITRSRITGTPLSAKTSEAKEPTLIHTELTLPVVPQDPKRRNNRNNNSNSKKQNKIKTIVDAEKTRVINPKPIRLSSLKSFSVSRNTNFDWNGCSSQGGDTEFGNPWSNDQNGAGVGFLIGNAQSYDLVNSTSLASEQHEPRLDDNVEVEKL